MKETDAKDSKNVAKVAISKSETWDLISIKSENSPSVPSEKKALPIPINKSKTGVPKSSKVKREFKENSDYGDDEELDQIIKNFQKYNELIKSKIPKRFTPLAPHQEKPSPTLREIEKQNESDVQEAIKCFKNYDLKLKATPSHDRQMSLLYAAPKMFPDWYQELSDRQIRAADSIHEHLQLDTIMGTTSYMRICIRGIGLKPIPSLIDIKRAIDLSRGSDLAFLWILWDICFHSFSKDQDDYDFDLNERIIFSTICHLDMITTLKELDRLLPAVPEKPKKKVSCLAYEKNVCSYNYENVFNYLGPLPRPKYRESRFIGPPKIPDPHLSPYSKYADECHIVLNETTRWFKNKNHLVENREVSESELNMKNSVIFNISEPFSNDGDRLDNLLKLLVDKSFCPCSNLNMDDMKPSSTFTFISASDLAAISEEEEFRREATTFLHQMIAQETAKALIEHSKEISYIKLCSHCRVCREYLDSYHSYLQRKGSPIDRPLSIDQKAPQIDFKRLCRACIYGSFDENSKQLALDLDKAAKEIQTDDSQEQLTVCMRQDWMYDVRLWKDHSVTHRTEAPPEHPFSPESIDFTKMKHLDKLLSNSLTKLRTNPKFVLAALPDAQKIPFLRKWIRFRYGYRYSPKDRKRALRKSKTLWIIFDRSFPRIREPNVDDVCPGAVYITNSNRDFIVNRIAELDDDYTKRFKQALISRQRKFWTTLRPFMCTGGPPRQTFFAYMPDSEYHIFVMKPWLTFEVR